MLAMTLSASFVGVSMKDSEGTGLIPGEEEGEIDSQILAQHDHYEQRLKGQTYSNSSYSIF